jgi:hypothetical protein
MTSRIGISTIQTGLISLLNTNIAELNTGLTSTVKQIIYSKPDINDSVIASTLYPTVIVYFRQIACNLRGASTRYEVKIQCEIHSYVRNMKGVKEATAENITLLENIAYVIQNNVGTAFVSNGYIKNTGISADDYFQDTSGFIAHGVLQCEIVRMV